MNENLNLCEILKGKETKTFYTDMFGYVTLIHNNGDFLIFGLNQPGLCLYIEKDGIVPGTNNYIGVFPCKTQIDWRKYNG